MTASIVYTGNFVVRLQHIQSGTTIETDAPTDNRGKGEKFSPTDLLCVSLATCMLTTMGIKAGELGLISPTQSGSYKAYVQRSTQGWQD